MAPKLTFNQAGAIVRLRLRNFMTYNDVSLTPGPNLNMIIGPNGTGKSAIVCSIIVGLAGDVSLTGRANSIASLVQKGKDWASTEIELYNDKGRNHVIYRKITITSLGQGKVEHKSEWKLNNNSVTKRTVNELIDELNIKVDNLCQFLPQDSVASFVKMNSNELLTNTLKAVGDIQLVEDLDNLIKLTDDISSQSGTLADLKKLSAENEVNARRLETEVQELQAREMLVAKKKTCSLKIHYARYTEAVERSDRAKDELRDKKEYLRQQKNNDAPVQKKVDFYKSEETKYQSLVREQIDSSKRTIELINKSWDNLEQRKMNCQDEYRRFKSMQSQEEQREQQINLKEQELESHKSHLDEIRDVDYTNDIADLKKQAKDVQVSLKAKHDEKSSFQQELRQLVVKIEDIRAKRAELLSVRDKRLLFVISRRHDYRRVCDWLSLNKDMFQKDILLPIYCDLNIKDPAFADIIEYSINEQDLYAFICQTEDDLKSFSRHAHDVLKARINIILQPDKTVEEFERDHANRDQDRYRRMNFAGHLKDMVEAPEPVMRYLYGNYNFHRIPIFNNLNESDLKQIMDMCPKFFTKKVFYNVQKSRYDQARTVFNEKIPEARILRHSTFNKQQLEDLNQQLKSLEERRTEVQDRISSIDQESQQYQQKFLELNNHCKGLLSKQNERDRLEKHIELCSRKLEELKSEKIDIAAEQIKLQDSIRSIDQSSVEDLSKLDRLFHTYTMIRQNHLLYTMLSTLARKNYRLAEISHEEAIKKVKELEQQIDDDKKRLALYEKVVTKSAQAAEENIPGFKKGTLNKQTKANFATIEYESVEELERYEEELKARIQGMQGVVSSRLLDDYNRQNAELQDRRKQIVELEASIAALTEQQSSIKSSFLSQLNGVINVIDEHYKVFMQKLNYDGKVELARDLANLDDYSKYGINIMVKYRDDEQLIPLSSTRQSGGERSVATMIYMLALQTKTSVPFRVVDEINQGMDKDNERKVFELLVRTADESSSQYFLVSPKLLSGLNYGDKMQIHIVFNGPQLNYSFNDLKLSDRDEAYASDSTSSSEGEGVVVRPKRRSVR